MSTAASNTIQPRPLEQRHWLLRFENEDGTAGEEAFPINYEELYNLKGRLLTIVDATFTDPQQRKAMKDIVWQALQGWMKDIESDAGVESLPPTKFSESP